MGFAPKTKPAAAPAQQAALLKAQKAPVSAPRAAQAPQAAPVPAVRQQGAIALPADLMAELGAAAKEAAAKERPQVSRISLKSGVMSYGGDAVPGNNMDVIIVCGAQRNVFYAGQYDPNNIVNPNCFALGDGDEPMLAHENVPDESVPEASEKTPRETPRSCKGCAMNEWGSDLRGGRGKACKETRRLIVLPANVLDDENPAEAIAKSEMAIIDLPVTSVGNYGSLVNSLAATLGLPVWAVVTNVLVSPHAKKQFEVTFTPLRPAGDEETIRALMKRRDEALRLALVPYDGVGGEADPNAGKAAAPAAPLKNKFAAKTAARR